MSLKRALKQAIKARLKQLRAAIAWRWFGYDRAALLRALRRLGVMPGDTVMLHSAFSPEHGFRGSAAELIETFLEAVGPEGHLLMVSLPYRNAALDWLESGRRFDVRKTPSMMGMVSEVFRRRPDVLRSLHPTHPVLVHGPRALDFVQQHAECVYPCGPGSPFDVLARADGKVVFLNVPLDTFTFFHYLEHLVSPMLPFALYTETVYEAPVVDSEGRLRTVRTHAFAREAIRRRRPERLYEALQARGSVARERVGATRLLLVRVHDAIACTQELQARGALFYDVEAPASAAAA
jgi:aminoglycoside 3-N-acetyltransferase